MTTPAEYMILSGADNRPPMLDKDLYDSWKSRMEVYMKNKEHERMILESVEHGLLIWPMIEENRVTRTKKYAELSAIEKLQADWETKFHAVGTSGTRANTSGIGGSYSGHQRIVKCFNCQGEGHMARQCLKPKRKWDATWFREKVLLVEAQGNGKVLNEEELEFLADPSIVEGPVQQSVITHNAAYQANDLDAYDSNCDEISTAKAVLMASLSSYGSNVLSEVPYFKNTNIDMLNQSVQEMTYFEHSQFVEHLENEIHGDSNIILYFKYLTESQTAAFQDTNSFAQQDVMILSVFEQLYEQVTNCNNVNKDNLMANESLSTKLKRYKERKVKELDNIVCKMGQSTQTVHMLTKPQVFYHSNLKQALGFQNPFYLKKAQQIRTMLYDGNVIAKETNVISIANSEETLMLEEES
uniref:CCHC-type domain-containing protein n=1 Tax=Tanacetum cinerariifolium TaxID=118510 RepID=A0A6L2M1N6_TANCI|nr:hypothetical protein [Tanacetum cinerariifolium]